jgi:hypothetical protein
MRGKLVLWLGVAAAMFLVAAPSASAKWILGNGSTDLEITTPSGLNDGQVCTTSIQGRAGLSTSDDPSNPATPPPPGPYAPITVRVYTGPAGSLDGSLGSASPIVTYTTAAPTALNPAESYFGDFSQTFLLYEYAAASFTIPIPAGAIPDGNEVAVQNGSHSAYVTLSAKACSTAPPPPVTAFIDVLPGIRSNPVIPWLRHPTLVVRLFGSALLDVRGVSGVKLGDAQAAPIPPALAKLFVPKDRNGDGILDRDFLFVPAATGITCGSTTVSLTGTISGGGTFSGSDAVKPIC